MSIPPTLLHGGRRSLPFFGLDPLRLTAIAAPKPPTTADFLSCSSPPTSEEPSPSKKESSDESGKKKNRDELLDRLAKVVGKDMVKIFVLKVTPDVYTKDVILEDRIRGKTFVVSDLALYF